MIVVRAVIGAMCGYGLIIWVGDGTWGRLLDQAGMPLSADSMQVFHGVVGVAVAVVVMELIRIPLAIWGLGTRRT